MNLKTIKFIQKAKLIHGDTYDYSITEYIKASINLKIICKIHGVFEQYCSNHLGGGGCSKCGFIKIKQKTRLTLNNFITRSNNKHNDLYDYSKVKYINSKTRVIIICKKHGEFHQTPASHLSGSMCPICSLDDKRLKPIDFIKRANSVHNGLYDYSMTEYINPKIKVIVICSIHGIFEQAPYHHLNGHGCKKCSIANFSKISIEWLNSISKLEDVYIQHAMNEGEFLISDTKYRVDGYCKENNTVYEFLGDFWHGNPEKYLSEDINPITKEKYGISYDNTIKRLNEIKSLGYNIEYIWENNYKNNKNNKNNINIVDI